MYLCPSSSVFQVCSFHFNHQIADRDKKGRCLGSVEQNSLIYHDPILHHRPSCLPIRCNLFHSTHNLLGAHNDQQPKLQ